MIAITCPSCSIQLEIDDGFRGGVCRCSECGAMMTVPDDPRSGQVQALKRPESPAAVSPQAALAAAVVAPPPPPTAPPPPRPAAAASQASLAAVLAAQQRAATTPTTAPTKKSSAPPQPTEKERAAHKRSLQIHLAVWGGAFVIAAALVGGVIWLGVFLFYKPPPPSTRAADVYADVLGDRKNAYTSTQPQFMGLPVAGKTVMLIDGSSAMRQQIHLVNQAVIRSVPTLGSGTEAQVIFWSDVAPIAYPAKPTPADKIDKSALASRLEDISLSGSPEPAPAFALALSGKPDQITVVVRSLPDEKAFVAIETGFKTATTKLFVVHLDGSESDPDAVRFKKLAESSGGKYYALNSATLRGEYEEYQLQLEKEEDAKAAKAAEESKKTEKK